MAFTSQKPNLRIRYACFSSNYDMDQLPLELIVHIFSKTTWKSLKQCRRVSKSWHAALSDTATLRSLQSSIKLPECLVLHINHKDSPSSTNPRFICLYDQTIIPSSDNALFKIPLVTDPVSATTKLVGSCNGLLCWRRIEPAPQKLYFVFTVYISNPMTGESMTIPIRSHYIRQNRNLKIGFGYVPNTKQYKLVYVTNETGVSVLTLGNGIPWRRLECPNYELYDEFGVHVNRAIHWIYYGQQYRQRNIVSFDLETEQFRILPKPPEAPDYLSGITVLKDWLMVWEGKRIWMRMDRGGSWVDKTFYEFHKETYERPLIVYPKTRRILVLRPL